ncbi:predicted protein [Histoplasma capsulatum var. duboisii H88]|uniref:Predicted protein n=1 Tax=Ajellomyces capsulatus (strain H88) TaxID=544711 RepID=F0UC48_AJEC8|nr:predicted protein [Histoplasma capsulatum var. duboisii H88]
MSSDNSNHQSAAAAAAANTAILAAAADGKMMTLLCKQQHLENEAEAIYQYRPPIPMRQFEFDLAMMPDEAVVKKFQFTKHEIGLILPYIRLDLIQWSCYEPAA